MAVANVPKAIKPLSEARIAIVYEWLIRYVGGYERVAASIQSVLPTADHFSLVHNPKGFQGSPLEKLRVQTSFIQSLPRSKRNYQLYLLLMPLAVERFDLSAYDIVISLSHAVAKGAITSPDQLHVCYLQARNLKYAYEDRFFYPRNAVSGFGQDFFLSKLRVWDSIASRRPDFTIANSRYVSNWHLHRHDVRSAVVYPPVDVTHYSQYFRSTNDGYYVTVGRLEPYKRTDLIVEAFKSSGQRLVVIGDGSMMSALKGIAGARSNIEFLGHCDATTIAQVVAGAKAFVFASREDFGIAPLEAQATGCPVIAYGKGGASETIVGWPASEATGVFFDTQTPEALKAAVNLFEAHETRLAPKACKRNAERFGQQRFQREFQGILEEIWKRFQGEAGLDTLLWREDVAE